MAEAESFRHQRYSKPVPETPEHWIYAQVAGVRPEMRIYFAPSRLKEMQEKYGELIFLKNKPKGA